MVNGCVAGGCNKTCKDGTSLFSFPKYTELKKNWLAQVSRTRVGWKPTEHSCLCSCNFEENCFEIRMKESESLGLGKSRAKLLQLSSLDWHQKEWLGTATV